MNNGMIPSFDPTGVIGVAGQMFPLQTSEDFLDLAVGSAIHTAAEAFREAGARRAEADRVVLETLAEKEGGEAASTYRREAAQADACRMDALGNNALMVGGGLLAAGLLYALFDALNDL